LPYILDDFESDATPAAGALLLELVGRYLEVTGRGEGPVSTGLTPVELAQRFAGPMPRRGRPLDEVVAHLERDVLPHCNRLTHPMYLGHQVSAPLPAAIWTESLTGAINNSLAVAEMSPAITAIERQLIRWMADLAGYGAEAGGTFTSGGTEATFTALLAARARALPDAWENGIGSAAPAVVYGENAHYAVTRAIGELGIGLRAGVVVPNRDFCMDAAALNKALEDLARKGRQIMAVVATAGSTPTGSFDDLESIGQVCEARGIWLHVDGAHGASALLSSRHRHRMKGIERARSIAWDPHKMMLLPLSAGMLVVRDERDLDQAFLQRAPYLFHGAENQPVPDQGVRSFACSRRADALKAWVALLRYGADGIGELYDRLCDLTADLYGLIERHSSFETFHAPESNILCFRFVGDGRSDDASLDLLNKELRERFNRSGVGWITTTVLNGRRVLRVTIMNPRTRAEHLQRLLDGLLAEAGRMA
jgi:L-2,4-diaminobutyrate decarboxylase